MFFIATLLAGCGQKGPLYQPVEQPSTSAPASQSGDNSGATQDGRDSDGPSAAPQNSG